MLSSNMLCISEKSINIFQKSNFFKVKSRSALIIALPLCQSCGNGNLSSACPCSVTKSVLIKLTSFRWLDYIGRAKCCKQQNGTNNLQHGWFSIELKCKVENLLFSSSFIIQYLRKKCCNHLLTWIDLHPVCLKSCIQPITSFCSNCLLQMLSVCSSVIWSLNMDKPG